MTDDFDDVGYILDETLQNSVRRVRNAKSKRFKSFVKSVLKRAESIEEMSDSHLTKCLRRFHHSLRRNDNKP